MASTRRSRVSRRRSKTDEVQMRRLWTNLDEGLDSPLGNVQERRPSTHVGPLAHGRRGINEEHYDGHA